MPVAHPPEGRPVVTRAMLESGLRELGLCSGDIVVAHSALRSFGWLEGGEDTVIEALLSCLGPAGTLCMPTLTYGTYSRRHLPPPFDPASTPGIVGRVPERFRQRPGVERSLHPTHSVAACGSRALELLSGHDRSPTPCGPDSPWGRMARAGGSVLMMGVDLFYCTMFHGPEEEAEPDARCTQALPCPLVDGGEERPAWLRLHKPYRGAVSGRAEMAPSLEAEGLLRRTRVGDSEMLLVDARGLWDLSLSLLRARPARRIDCMKERVHSNYRRLRASFHHER